MNQIKNEHIIFNENNNFNVVEIRGLIGSSFFNDGYTANDFKNDINNLDDKPILIEISSNGGSAYEAFEIYDNIINSGKNITTRIVGTSASAATIIHQAGTVREITKNSRYLIHRSQKMVQGHVDDLRKVIDELNDVDQQIVDLYSQRSKKSPDEIKELMIKDTTISPEEALAWGFVDKILNNNNMKKNEIKNETIQPKDEVVLNQEIEKSGTTEEVENQETEEVEKSGTTEEVENQETEEVENQETDEVEKDDKDDIIEVLKNEINELKKKLDEKEVEEAEARADKAKEYVSNLVEQGFILNESSELWLNITLERGIDDTQKLLDGINKSDKKSFKDINNQKIERTDVVNSKDLWKLKQKGLLTLDEYVKKLNKIKN